MDRFQAMSILVSVVDEQGFSAASRKLKMPVATVSRRISELEAQLGTQLLVRSTRSLNLTEAGTHYLAAARRILEDVSEAERRAAGEFLEPKGNLAITAPIVFGRLHLLPVINDFLREYPEVNIQLEQSDRSVNLFDEHLDLAVRIGHLADSSLVARKVGEVRRITCASPDYLAQEGTPKTPDQLSQHQCITFRTLLSSQSWRYAKDGRISAVEIQPRLVVNTAEAAINAAEAGLGLTRVLSYQMAAAEAAGRLQRVLTDNEADPLPVSLVYTQQSLMPQKLRAFIDFAAPRLQAALNQ